MTEEELMVHDFINAINYPRYNKVMKILSNTVECKHMYNGYYHDLLGILWDNLRNDNLVTNIGLKIQKRGGNDAVRICFYIIMNVLRYITNNDNECRYIIFQLKTISVIVGHVWEIGNNYLFELFIFLIKLFCIVIYNVRSNTSR